MHASTFPGTLHVVGVRHYRGRRATRREQGDDRDGPNYLARHLSRESVAVVVQIIGLPVAVMPRAPSGEQKAPAVTPVRTDWVVVVVVVAGFVVVAGCAGVGVVVATGTDCVAVLMGEAGTRVA